MAIYDGELHAYWEQGWEGRIEYALASEGQPHPRFLTTGQHLTIYATDGSTLWQGRLRFVSRGREQHHLPTGIWAFEKQRDVPYGQWLGWFLHDPPPRATVVDEPDPPGTIDRGPSGLASSTCFGWTRRACWRWWAELSWDGCWRGKRKDRLNEN